MILKYREFYTLINIIKYITNKNNTVYQKLCLLKYYNLGFVYGLYSKEQCLFKNLRIDKYILGYLYKFFSIYIDVMLIKYSRKKFINLYFYLNFFNFFFKFLNWYCNFLNFNVHVFIIDENVLRFYNYKVNNNDINFFNELINIYNCKFFINLNKKISKNTYRLFSELDIYVLDLSHTIFNKYNKNNILQLLFLMRNLITFCNLYKKI